MITDKRIIYPHGETIAVVIPSPDYEGTVAELAASVVPDGVKYRVVDAIDLPDRTYRAAWTANFSTYDGIGGAK